MHVARGGLTFAEMSDKTADNDLYPELLNRRELRITDTLEKAIAPAASIGFILPIAASGIITTL